MQFARYSSPIAAGTAGFLAGLFYHNFHYKRFLHVSSANPDTLDINGIISKGIETSVTKVAPIMKYGCPSYDTLRTNEHFMLAYDRRNKVPSWVMEHLTSDMFVQADDVQASRDKCKWFEDKSIHSYFRSTDKDYAHSNYDRGHMAAAANYKYSQEALDYTFVFSNVAPQNKNVNRGIWKQLEERVRSLAKSYGSVYVCSGPLYLPRNIHSEDQEMSHLLQDDPARKRKRKKVKTKRDDNSITKKFVLYEVIGANNVAVPTDFFKIIICELEDEVYAMEAYIIPNHPEQKKPLEDYMVPRGKIEKYAGFLLFQNLPNDAIRCINGKESSPINSSLEDV